MGFFDMCHSLRSMIVSRLRFVTFVRWATPARVLKNHKLNRLTLGQQRQPRNLAGNSQIACTRTGSTMGQSRSPSGTVMLTRSQAVT